MNDTHPGEDQLIAFALDELEGEDRARVESHLGTCEACNGTVMALRGAVDGLRTAPRPEPPARVLVDLLATQATTTADRPAPWWRRTSLPRWALHPLPAAAVMTVLVLLSFWAGRLSVHAPATSGAGGAARADSSSVIFRALPDLPEIPFEPAVTIENS